MSENKLLIIKNNTEIDVLDEKLYSYESAIFTVIPSVKTGNSEKLYRKIKQYFESMPAIQNASDKVRSKIEYIPRFDLVSEEIQQAVKDGLAELIPCKSSSGDFFLQIRTTVKGLVIEGKEYSKKRIIKDIPLGTKEIPVDINGAMQCLATQSQFNQINKAMMELSEACEFNFGRIIQGQRDDRLAKLLSSRSNYIQAMALSDDTMQRQLLLQSISDANSARALLAYQIRSDVVSLGDDKVKSKDRAKIVADTNVAIVAMNNAVQLQLYSYQALGEHTAQLAVVKEHQTFLKQVLLKSIDYKGKKYTAWSLISSSGKSGTIPKNFKTLPKKLISDCDTFIASGDLYLENLLEDNINEEK